MITLLLQISYEQPPNQIRPPDDIVKSAQLSKYVQRGHIYPVGLIFFIIIFIMMITINIITIIIAIIIFFGLFGDTRRLLLQFTFLWSSAKGEWHSKSLNTIERCSKVKFSSEALLKQILGSPFLDVRLKSKSHVTSDYRYFNSVI